jgi:hypothetical protein
MRIPGTSAMSTPSSSRSTNHFREERLTKMIKRAIETLY